MSSRRWFVTPALALAGVLSAPSIFAQVAPGDPPPPAKPGEPAWNNASPAKDADPPLIPKAPEPPPTSASGTDLEPSAPVERPTVYVNSIDREAEAKQDARMRELEARLEADEKRMRRLEERQRTLRWFKLGAFVQPQFLLQSYDANASPNQANGALPAGISSNAVVAKSDGTTTNGTMFRMRRTRLRTTFESGPAKLYVELDPFPVGGIGPGIGTVVRDAEATGTARWARDLRTELSAGVFMLPMRQELRERSDVRPFIERSWATQNVFPTERDIGVHARSTAMHERLVLDLGIVNGQHLGEPRFVAQPDLDKSKDLFAHLRYRLGPISFGISGYAGRGQVVDAQNLRFKGYGRWWVNYELSAHQRILRALGETRVVGELAIGQNMDTGINYPFAVPSIPARIGDEVRDLDERALTIRLEQDLTRMFQVGYRYDFYTTDTTIKNNARDTHAFVTVVRFTPNLRWMNEIDYAIDNVHPTSAPAPARHLFAFSSVMQVGF